MHRLLVLALVAAFAVACSEDPQCRSNADCNDRSECTKDSCEAGVCVYREVDVDDGNLCTDDRCHPIEGVLHEPYADISDGNACTEDVCDPATGNVSHPALAAIDDRSACTEDSCDPVTGKITNAAVDTDDGDPCTDDLCDPATGAVTHPPIAALDDEDLCTTDGCDSATGAISHEPLATINDSNRCTLDGCDPDTGVVTHAPLAAIDDGDGCTVDSCEPATGDITHEAKVFDDGIDCTADRCDPATGTITNAPDHSQCAESDERTCSEPRCVPGRGCEDTPVDANCDDGQACTVTDACDPANGDAVTGCRFATDDSQCADDGQPCTVESCDPEAGCVRTYEDSLCEPGTYCYDSGCAASAPLATAVRFTEFRALGAEFVELHNPGERDARLQGFFLENAAGQTGAIRPVSDPTGSGGAFLVIPARGYAYGVANPASADAIPADAAFVVGEPGSDFTLADAGDRLVLRDANLAAMDTLDFATALAGDVPAFHTSAATAPALRQFPGSPSVSTQLDVAQTGGSNDDGSSWCLTFRANDTRGAANQSCSAFVINEVLYDFDHPLLAGSDEGRAFVELAGPGGGVLEGVRLAAIDGTDRKVFQKPDVTIGVTPDVRSPVRMPLDGFFVVADGSADNAGTLVPGADLVLGMGDPVNGTSNGDGLVLLAKDGTTVLDALVYGPGSAGEGQPVADLDPDEVAISIARDALARDTGNNAADFHFDPSPTPGAANLPVAPAIVSIGPADGLASAATRVTVVARDFADFDKVAGARPEDNDVNATFAGVTTTDTISTYDGCDFVGADDDGRGAVTLVCTAPVRSAGALRGAFVLQNPAALGGASLSRSNAWTYTGVRNETGSGEVEFCVLETALLSVQEGLESARASAAVNQPGITEAAGEQASIVVEFGSGPIEVNPASQSGWIFRRATWDAQAGGADRYSTSFTGPEVAAATQVGFSLRVSLDGGLTYTYCDADGAGSRTGASYEPTKLGVLSIAALTGLAIEPPSAEVFPGGTHAFAARAAFSDGSSAAVTSLSSWASADPAIASVDAAGLATGVAPGTAQIGATFLGEAATGSLVVNAVTLVSVEVLPAQASVFAGSTLQMTALGHYNDGSTKDDTASATWATSDPLIATVSDAAGSKGLVTGVAFGGVTVTATVGSATGETNLTVNSAE